MEVMLQSPKTFSDSVKKKKMYHLGQLIEETRRSGNVSHHLLETRVFAKVKSNSVVEVEPSELHFGGFEVGKEYKKVLKLINISSEVLNVHILPTQTKYFRTEYTPKSRLVPGLSYSINVYFSPNEWRYFYDSVRIHCKGDENLLVPVHAYPVIDDLHMPSRISLPTVSLGQSATHVFPLSCSFPVDFEFQVHCLQSHEAFSINPLSGVIPANGSVDVTVTYTPLQYGTAEMTLQLVTSQFNSKPFVCTLTASCSPHLTLNKQTKNDEFAIMVPKAPRTKRHPDVLFTSPKPKLKVAPSIEKQTKKKIKSEPCSQTSGVDITTPAGLAKMLIQHQDKISYTDLREAMSHTKTAQQTRQMTEAAFANQVRINVQKEKANLLRWQVHLGDDLISAEDKLKVLKEQEFAASEYMVQTVMSAKEVDVAQSSPRLSSHRVVRSAGQYPDCTPVFNTYGCSQLKVRQRVLRLFQQAVHKVVLCVRMNNRLLLLRKAASSTKNDTEVDAKQQLLNLSSEKLLPFALPIFTSTDLFDELAINRLGRVHVRTIKPEFTPCIPFFNLKVPQRYRIMGYQEMSVHDAQASFVHAKLCRPLRTGAQDELLPTVMYPDLDCCMDNELQKDQGPEQKINPVMEFNAPKDLLNPPNAHPLRIFNPAPSVYAYKQTPLYLESDPEFHLCPLPKYTVSKDKGHTFSTQKAFLNRKDIIKGVMMWKKFPCLALNTFSSVSTPTSNCAQRICDPFNNLVLPLEAPPPLLAPLDSITDEDKLGLTEGPGTSLTPDMVHAEFGLFENSLKEDSNKNDEESHEELLESTGKSQTNKLAHVLARMKCLKYSGHSNQIPHDSK
ncbi:cilia- and flagella-associated protein 221 [Trichomycterus rosablanca]|uniref:cilia- and flagella-associated protein 221 n=1 Tax=Trichomycterus rosablanca TaxID=2290929 RepID=UPI002F360DC4